MTVTATERRQAKSTKPNRRRGGAPESYSATFWFLLVIVGVLTLLGGVMVLSASAAEAISESSSAWSIFRRQVLWIALGLSAMAITMRIDYHRWQAVAPLAIWVAGIMLWLPLIPGLGVSINGARRWVILGGISVQPSEFAKVAVILSVAAVLARKTKPIENFRLTLVPIAIATVWVMLPLIFQPHLGAIMVIGVTVFAMLFFGGARFMPLAAAASVGVGGIAAMIIAFPWRRDRFFAFLDPWSAPDTAGYQPLQSLYAITSGGLTGVGLGNSYAKWGFLPFAHTDFIFAVIAEELGLLGALFVLTLFLLLGFAGMAAALNAPDRFGVLLATGVTAWIVFQALLNIGAVISWLPVTGVTLPFLSFGGSSLVASLAGIGIVLNVARQGR